MQASRRLGLALLVPTSLLTLGVVYCQMHYGVDAVAGLVVGAVVAILLRNERLDTKKTPQVNAEGSSFA